MGKFSAQNEKGSKIEIEMDDRLLYGLLDKPFGREEVQETAPDGHVRVRKGPFEGYEGGARLIASLARGEAPTSAEASGGKGGGATGTALDLSHVEDVLSVLEGVKVDLKTDAPSQTLALKVTLPDGREVTWTGTGFPVRGPTGTALDAGDEVVAENGEAPRPAGARGLAWKMLATASTDPDRTEQDGVATAVQTAGGLIATNAANSATTVNFGVFIYNLQNVDTNTTTTTTTPTSAPVASPAGPIASGGTPAGGTTLPSVPNP